MIRVAAIIAAMCAACSTTTGTTDTVEYCEDEALDCLNVALDSANEGMDYMRGEFCGCIGQWCIGVIREARRDGAVEFDVEEIMNAARCSLHRKVGGK
jgi:hypothetical protein